MKRFEAPTEPTGETIPDPYEERRAALTAERQKARREEQDYAAVRRNVEEFLSPPRQVPARQKDMELECPLGQTFCRNLRFPLSFCRNVRYNEDINDFEGGEPHDKRRGIAALFYRSGYHIVACAVASILLHESCPPNRNKKPPIPTEQTVISGTPGAIRTHGLWSRSPTLYPAELRARVHDIVYQSFAHL